MQLVASQAPTFGTHTVAATTVCQAVHDVVARRPHDTALRSADDSFTLTWRELYARIEQLAAGFAALGIGHGTTVAMLLPNIPECHLVDYSALHVGALPFTIYNTSAPEQIAYQLENADARTLVTQAAFLPRVRAAEAILGTPLDRVVIVDGGEDDLTLDDIVSAGDPAFDFEASWRSVGPDHLATLIYTSGTTGPPKGAQLTHGAVMAQQRIMAAAVPIAHDNLISFLPMAHTGGRASVHYLALTHGATITACPNMADVARLTAQIHPDAFFSVPRLWEKFQVAIESMIDAEADPDLRARTKDALATRIAQVEAQDAGHAEAAHEQHDPTGDELALLTPVVARLGLDRCTSAFVGGAPCAPEVIRFFRAVGIPLLEAYGSTETGLVVFNRVDEFKSGTAGRPLPGVEVRVADDGELLVRSAATMVGYRKDPVQTSAALDSDGWLRTGDIAVIDEAGWISIVDRKKELIINAAGKNMSPANIELAIRGETALIGQIVTIGDKRSYNVALVTLDPDAAAMHARRLGLEHVAVADLARAPEIVELVQEAIDKGNTHLSRVEQVKRFVILPTAWQADSDELTPTLKLKRRAIVAKYSTFIDDLYSG